MNMQEVFSNYPQIADKAAQTGKIKPNVLTKKAFANADEQWNRLFPEELAKLNDEIANAELYFKKAYCTPTAICYNSVGCFFVIPVKDIIWVYVRVVKESMNFIPTGKIHQIWVVDRSGETYLICDKNTGPFTKQSPAEEVLQQMKSIMDPVRPGIFYGYSKELEAFVRGNLPGAAAQVDNASSAQ
ncbi:MAG: hypothetical protein IKD90_03315 [Clostridiales bacterium]|nr:hypothetical protein [Clostridiales bacterium]